MIQHIIGSGKQSLSHVQGIWRGTEIGPQSSEPSTATFYCVALGRSPDLSEPHLYMGIPQVPVPLQDTREG